MRRIVVTVSALVGIFGSAGLAAQAVVTQHILSLSAAREIAEAALTACTSRGFHTSVVVVDRSGQPLVVLRHEQAHPVTVEMAKGKAYTAVVFRGPTLEFQQKTASDPTRTPQRDVPGILALGGGVPIIVDGEILGGVASSGSSQTTDDECARAGAARAEALLEDGTG